MEIIKRKILLENLISRASGSTYGTITATTININIPLYQEIKDLGMVNSMAYIPKDGSNVDYSILISKLNNQSTINNTTFNFVTNPDANFVVNDSVYSPDTRYPDKVLSDYFKTGRDVSGYTEDRLESVYSYGFTGDDRLIPNRNVTIDNYINYEDVEIEGVTRVISNNQLNPVIYTEDGSLSDANVGNTTAPYQENGLLFETTTGRTRTVSDGSEINLTTMYYKGQNLNNTNVELSAFTREEYLLYITQEPKVESDVFIDRGATSVLPSHTQLAEINTLEQLENFGNGFYNLIKF